MNKKINSIQLSKWIIHNLPKTKTGLTHLKLQKLCFYCYGISLAKGFGDCFEQIYFVAWKHGPVSKDIYNEFKNFGVKDIIKDEVDVPNIEISKDLSSFMMKILYIYGGLDSWKISHQSHLEEPWKIAFQIEGSNIDELLIKENFKNKFFQNFSRIFAPEYVFDLSSFKLDGIPTVGYSSFNDLAEAAKRIYFTDYEKM